VSAIHKHRLSATGAVLMGISVAMGAFGAHTLKDLIEVSELQTFKTGVLYALIHGLVLWVWPIFKGSFTPRQQKNTWRLFLIGYVLFCGSLWVMTIGRALDVDWSFLGMITPLGGLSWIIAWFWTASLLIKK